MRAAPQDRAQSRRGWGVTGGRGQVIVRGQDGSESRVTSGFVFDTSPLPEKEGGTGAGAGGGACEGGACRADEIEGTEG